MEELLVKINYLIREKLWLRSAWIAQARVLESKTSGSPENSDQTQWDLGRPIPNSESNSRLTQSESQKEDNTTINRNKENDRKTCSKNLPIPKRSLLSTRISKKKRARSRHRCSQIRRDLASLSQNCTLSKSENRRKIGWA